MKDFRENVCRLCPKVFCCKECRASHEEIDHKVNPQCDICIYGRTTINKASTSLLNHISTTHWPLYCVFCAKVFKSIDELVPHSKCSANPERMKIPRTPVTPINENSESSPALTPFYYQNKVPGNQQFISIGATSTPLLHKEETEKNDKITPIYHSDVKYIYKSSLKLTGSGSLTDSKKTERRVTFVETPSIEINEVLDAAKSIDDSYVSVEDGTFLTASSASAFDEEKENDTLAKCDSNATIWESALTNLDLNTSKFIECVDNGENHYNLALQINVFNDKSDNSSLNASDVENKSTSIWSSMTNMVKSVMNNISVTSQNSFASVGVKRPQPDNDSLAEETPYFKRLKLTDIKCRRPIRNLSPVEQIRLVRPRFVDKAIQTDEVWV